MNPKISVIVPVYKAEKYLHRCVDSILAQTFTDFEVLLIDDGSPDRSGDICDEYAKKDSRVRVYHKENGGVTAARRDGVAMSQGSWISFVDSDDYLVSDALALMYNIEKNVDIVNACIEDKYKVWKHKIEGFLSRDELYMSLLNGSTYASVTGCLFRKNLFTDDVFLCPKDIKIGEDVLMKLQLAKYANCAININYPVYFYYTNEESVMQSRTRSILYYLRYNKLRNSIIGSDLAKQMLYNDLVEYLTAFYNRNIPFKKEYYQALMEVIRDDQYKSQIPKLKGRKMFLYRISTYSFLAIPYKVAEFYMTYVLKCILSRSLFTVLD